VQCVRKLQLQRADFQSPTGSLKWALILAYLIDENGTVAYNDTFNESDAWTSETRSLALGSYTALAESPGHS
jgi:hypothetical protein